MVLVVNEKMNCDLTHLTATELVRLLSSRKVSVEELCREFIRKIKVKDGTIRAWEYLNEELILGQARELDQKGVPKSLFGVPIGIKDIFNTKDMPSGMGSPIWSGFTPGNDARVVHSIRMEDGIIFGKTVTAEFAVHYLPKDKTVNPYDPKRTPGTSSSGSAAAVAAQMVPLALGTQTAGSTIRPASYCGIYALKPSFGLVPRTAMLKTTDTLDTVGWFARSIDDLKLMFEAIRVKGLDYPIVEQNLKPYHALGRKTKIGFLINGLEVFAGFDQTTIEEFGKYIDRLGKNKDVELSEFVPSNLFNRIHSLHGKIYDKTLAYYFKEEYKHHTLISNIMYEIIERGNKIGTAEYVNAVEEQSGLQRRITSELEDYDLIITPSTAGIAPLIEEQEKPDTCLIWTFLGYPALNIPVLKGPGGMPVGLQTIAKRFDDYKLLHIADRILSRI
jgi:Asp-tRNA(Asn)/Glu-tRNA(Gln) amidotransferase A subunit family amidase